MDRQAMANRIDLRLLPLRDRKATLARIGAGAKGWLALTNDIIGDGRALYRAVVAADLEGVVAKHLGDAYRPKFTRWHEILNRDYTQRRRRAEWFRKCPSAGRKKIIGPRSAAGPRLLPRFSSSK
jgi:hypothetical protein